MPPDEVEALATRFADVAPGEFDSSPLYRALCPVVAGDRELLELIAGRRPGQQPTKLFFAGLHYLVLRGAEHPFREFFPSVVGDAAQSPAEAGPAMLDFCAAHRGEIEDLMRTRLVQTSVVKRSAALRLGLTFAAADAVHLVEVGASSGVHLLHDRYAYLVGDHIFGTRDSSVRIDVAWRGSDAVPDLDRVPAMGRRIGVDLHPVSADDRVWLRALVWPENGHEAALLDAALDVVAGERLDMREGDIANLAPALDAELPAGEPRVVFHAGTRAHVPLERGQAFDDAILALGTRAPLTVVSLDGPAIGDPWPPQHGQFHVLRVRTPDGALTRVALVDGHGDWIEPLRDGRAIL